MPTAVLAGGAALVMTAATAVAAETTEQHAALQYWDPAAGCQPENAVLPLHPGARKLCQELGYLK